MGESIAAAAAPRPSAWKRYDSYDVPVDPKQGDRATSLKLWSLRRPHMRAFHFAWFGFFMAFLCWFAFAPLMPEVREDLGLTKEQEYMANIASVSSTVLARFVVGPLCDTFGARVMSSVLLIAAAIPTYLCGLVNNAWQLCLVRFLVGSVGAAFVCTQYWSSQMFAREVVGTANATTAGWGNLGGGVTQVFMVLVWSSLRTYSGGAIDSETAWRVSFVVPATLTLVVGLMQLVMADDCPMGQYSELVKRGTMRRKSATTSFRMGATKVNAWIMFVHYACCFGVELTMDNTAASYFHDAFGLSTQKAGLVASLFGLMNLFARSFGGMFSDAMSHEFGGGGRGMRGRMYAHLLALVAEGVMLLLFARARQLGTAVLLLVFFSLGTQAAEGTSYSIVPSIAPMATGSVSGIVGAGGTLGAVAWGLLFRFGPSDPAQVYLILGVCVLVAACTVPLLHIRGHDSILWSAGRDELAKDPLLGVGDGLRSSPGPRRFTKTARKTYEYGGQI